MKFEKLQHNIDLIIKIGVLWAIPKWVKPNHLSWARILSVPLLFWLLLGKNYPVALILFIISASTDFLDGTLARTRDQITEFGKILDPIADKLLIATVLGTLGYQYLIVKIFLVFIFLEILAVLFSSFLAYQIGRPPAANFFGKIKMILQSFSIGLLLPGLILNNDTLIFVATSLLVAALFFAILSAYKQIKAKTKNILKFFKLDKSIRTAKNLLKKI